MKDAVALPTPLDISSEEYREYTYANGNKFRINQPEKLFIVDGSHRVVDSAGVTHRPERNYVGISWRPVAGAPAFVA
jgi:hypothetical protein